MGIAFLPMILWAMGSVVTARATRHYGPAATNRWRLLIAIGVLGAWVAAGPGLPGHATSWGWLFLSGAIGLGLGDLAMLAGYRKIGPRLTVLLLLCLAVPVTGFSEWVWLGTPMSSRSAGWIALLLGGVTLTLAPGTRPAGLAADRRNLLLGILFGILAALGQGLSTTVSRVAYEAMVSDGVSVHGAVAAWQRMLGGFFCTVLAERVFRASAGDPPMARAGEMLVHDEPARPPKRAKLWLLLSALCGPILGLSAYQWALISLPGVLVQAISTLTPVAVIPIAWIADGDRPGWRGVTGGAIACAAAAALVLFP